MNLSKSVDPTFVLWSVVLSKDYFDSLYHILAIRPTCKLWHELGTRIPLSEVQELRRPHRVKSLRVCLENKVNYWDVGKLFHIIERGGTVGEIEELDLPALVLDLRATIVSEWSSPEIESVTPYQYACYKGRKEIVQHFLSTYNVEPNQFLPGGNSWSTARGALMFAVEGGDLDTVSVLLGRYMHSINAVCSCSGMTGEKYGFGKETNSAVTWSVVTPLHWAVAKGTPFLFSLLF
jgi:hypothetical protein